MAKIIHYSFALLGLIISSFPLLSQDQYDVYCPKQFICEQYQPKPGGSYIIIPPYSTKNPVASLEYLDQFIQIANTNKWAIDKIDLKGKFEDYLRVSVNCAKRNSAKQTFLGNLKRMRYFVDDYNALDSTIYQAYSSALNSKRQRNHKDSLEYRLQFVQDSLKKRSSFIEDSLHYRTGFVNDSLYRDNFRKKNRKKYDRIVFLGPHGPELCYYRGKLIDGWIYKDGILDEKWENGRCVYKRMLFDEHFTSYDKTRDIITDGHRRQDPLPDAPNSKVIQCYLNEYPVKSGIVQEPASNSPDSVYCGYLRYLESIYLPLCTEAIIDDIKPLLISNAYTRLSTTKHEFVSGYYCGNCLALLNDEKVPIAIVCHKRIDDNGKKHFVRIFPNGASDANKDFFGLNYTYYSLASSSNRSDDYLDYICHDNKWVLYRSRVKNMIGSKTIAVMRQFRYDGTLKEEEVDTWEKGNRERITRIYDSEGGLISER